ncbi:hypothetical protein ACOSP7_003957 [Xanthoceras sorbifolium]
MEGDDVSPPPASVPAKTRAPKVRGRGGAEGQSGELGRQETVMEPLTTSPDSSRLNDIDIEEQSTVKLETSSAPPAVSLDLPYTDSKERWLQTPSSRIWAV